MGATSESILKIAMIDLFFHVVSSLYISDVDECLVKSERASRKILALFFLSLALLL